MRYPAEILKVEDDEAIMGTLAYNVSRSGFGVGRATNGADALRLVRESKPNPFLLDNQTQDPFSVGSNL